MNKTMHTHTHTPEHTHTHTHTHKKTPPNNNKTNKQPPAPHPPPNSLSLLLLLPTLLHIINYYACDHITLAVFHLTDLCSLFSVPPPPRVRHAGRRCAVAAETSGCAPGTVCADRGSCPPDPVPCHLHPCPAGLPAAVVCPVNDEYGVQSVGPLLLLFNQAKIVYGYNTWIIGVKLHMVTWTELCSRANPNVVWLGL